MNPAGHSDYFFLSVPCSQYAVQLIFHMWCLHLRVAHKFAEIGLDFEELFYIIRCNKNEQEDKDGTNKTRGTCTY